VTLLVGWNLAPERPASPADVFDPEYSWMTSTKRRPYMASFDLNHRDASFSEGV